MPQTRDADRWGTIVGSLRSDVGVLVDRMLELLVSDEHYRSLGRDELYRTNLRVFTLILDALADDGDDPRDEIEALGQRIGASRMRAGLPLESLLSAIRLDVGIVWDALLDHAGRRDGYLIATHATSLWEVVDILTRSVQLGYLTQAQDLAGAERDEIRRQISLLFDPAGQFEANYSQIARSLGVSTTARFRVAALPSGSVTVLRRNVARAPAITPSVFTHALGTHLVAFWTIPDNAPLSPTRAEVRLLANMPAAVAPIARAISDIPLAALAAGRMLAGLDQDLAAVTDLTDSWPLLASRALTEIGCDLGQYVIAPLRESAEKDGDRLLETVAAYLRCGSLLETAEQLYCHRNTVLNRINRVRELTGLDLTRPTDAALALVALGGQSGRIQR